jgi:hypothetical protein
MTAEEHQLIIEMFKQQTLFYAGLVEILKSRDILEPGDLQAADALVIGKRPVLPWEKMAIAVCAAILRSARAGRW